SDSEKELTKKIRSMITDPKRIKLTDPGHPDVCNVFDYYKVFGAQQIDDVREWCEQASKGCSDCKVNLAQKIQKQLAPIVEKRSELVKDIDRVKDILSDGQKKAQVIARQTINEVKELVFV
ncbi:hypothetical protein MNBD_BACTEROID05-99, partial [hydrothermal vent metagenome]